jgi:hypothetical protein
MAIDEKLDPILRSLADLPRAVPLAARDERIRSRCHLVLARQRRTLARESSAAPVRVFDATLIAAAGIYAAAAALEALRLARVL